MGVVMDSERAPDGRSPSGPTVSIVLPAYNEASHLGQSLQTLCDHLTDATFDWEVIVVNDGSNDDTGEEARRFAKEHERVSVVDHVTNLGLGQALKTGFKAARGRYIVTFDADLSYSPDHVDRLVSTIETTGAKVVVASPYMEGGSVEGVPRLRALLSRVANRVLRTLSLSHVSTTTGMVRAYDARFITRLALKSVDNQLNAEIIYKTSLLRERVVEIPAHLRWTRDEADTKKRRGSFSIIRTTLDFLFSGFIFRPFMFFILPGAVLLLIALYALGWAMIHVVAAIPEQSGAINNMISDAAAVAFAASPHSFVIGGLALIFATQLISLGIVSAQSKRYFEELWYQGNEMSNDLIDIEAEITSSGGGSAAGPADRSR